MALVLHDGSTIWVVAISSRSHRCVKWGNGEKPVDKKYRLLCDQKIGKERFCWMTLFVLFYKVPLIAQRGLYLLDLFRRFILKVDGIQHPQAAFYIVPFWHFLVLGTFYKWVSIKSVFS